jgi:hypothetical protein
MKRKMYMRCLGKAHIGQYTEWRRQKK